MYRILHLAGNHVAESVSRIRLYNVPGNYDLTELRQALQ